MDSLLLLVLLLLLLKHPPEEWCRIYCFLPFTHSSSLQIPHLFLGRWGLWCKKVSANSEERKEADVFSSALASLQSAGNFLTSVDNIVSLLWISFFFFSILYMQGNEWQYHTKTLRAAYTGCWWANVHCVRLCQSDDTMHLCVERLLLISWSWNQLVLSGCCVDEP